MHLRSLVLELCERQVQMTDELAKLVVFLPRFGYPMRPFTRDCAGLKASLLERAPSPDDFAKGRARSMCSTSGVQQQSTGAVARVVEAPR
jgi:hypothetical protein